MERNDIRPLGPADIPQYAPIIRESFATVAQEMGLTRENCPGHTSFITDEKLRGCYENDYYAFGLYAADSLVGYFALILLDKQTYELSHLCVLPRHRHDGLGRKALDFCRRKVRSLGGKSITIGIIQDSHRLKNWYEAYGFVSQGTKTFPHLPFTVGYMALDIE